MENRQTDFHKLENTHQDPKDHDREKQLDQKADPEGRKKIIGIENGVAMQTDQERGQEKAESQQKRGPQQEAFGARVRDVEKTDRGGIKGEMRAQKDEEEGAEEKNKS